MRGAGGWERSGGHRTCIKTLKVTGHLALHSSALLEAAEDLFPPLDSNTLAKVGRAVTSMGTVEDPFGKRTE